MRILELIFRTIIFSWLKKRNIKLKESFIAYLYSRELKKRNKLEDGYSFRRTKAYS